MDAPLDPAGLARVDALLQELRALDPLLLEVVVEAATAPRGPAYAAASLALRSLAPLHLLLTEDSVWYADRDLSYPARALWDSVWPLRFDLVVAAYLGPDLDPVFRDALCAPLDLVRSLSWYSDPDWRRLFEESATNLGAFRAASLVSGLAVPVGVGG